MPHIHPRSALQAIKTFRTQQLKGLTKHLQLHGPLPTLTEAVVSNQDGSNTIAEPSIILPNPFIPRKNPKTGKWRCPKYSLRRQADLVKKAKETGNLSIMPPGSKMFAMELRMRRLQASLSPTDSAILAAAQASLKKPGMKSNVAETERAEKEKDKGRVDPQESTSEPQTRFSTFEALLRERQDKLAGLEQDLKQRQSQNELDELAAFEKSETDEDSRERRKRQAEYRTLQAQHSLARSEVVKAGQRLEKAREDYEFSKVEEAQERLWTNPFWVGDVKKKTTKGEELGVKLYAGKKKMFKGHTWEKEKAKRLRRQSILMRDMKTRIARYKSYYKKRKPNPLKPSRLSKPRKLPF